MRGKDKNPRKVRPLEERFWEKVAVAEENECWLWQAAVGPDNYGYINLGRKGEGVQHAHRVSYRLVFGEFPPELHVLHKCDVPLCVNPAHLFLGTIADNNRDMSSKGRNNQQQKTHCPQGHPYTEENTYLHSNGVSPARRCKICKHEQYLKLKERKRNEC